GSVETTTPTGWSRGSPWCTANAWSHGERDRFDRRSRRGDRVMARVMTPPAAGTKADVKSENGADSILAYGPARSTISGTPLSPEELDRTDAYWRASPYLCLGVLYLQDNPLP